MSGPFRIGKIAGIDIDINWSWIVILVKSHYRADMALGFSWLRPSLPDQVL
jgi:hypothetical protein